MKKRQTQNKTQKIDKNKIKRKMNKVSKVA